MGRNKRVSRVPKSLKAISGIKSQKLKAQTSKSAFTSEQIEISSEPSLQCKRTTDTLLNKEADHPVEEYPNSPVEESKDEEQEAIEETSPNQIEVPLLEEKEMEKQPVEELEESFSEDLDSSECEYGGDYPPSSFYPERNISDYLIPFDHIHASSRLFPTHINYIISVRLDDNLPYCKPLIRLSKSSDLLIQCLIEVKKYDESFEMPYHVLPIPIESTLKIDNLQGYYYYAAPNLILYMYLPYQNTNSMDINTIKKQQLQLSTELLSNLVRFYSYLYAVFQCLNVVVILQMRILKMRIAKRDIWISFCISIFQSVMILIFQKRIIFHRFMRKIWNKVLSLFCFEHCKSEWMSCYGFIELIAIFIWYIDCEYD